MTDEPTDDLSAVEECRRLTAGRQGRDCWRLLLALARLRLRAELGEQPLPAAEDIIRAMREERDEELLNGY